MTEVDSRISGMEIARKSRERHAVARDTELIEPSLARSNEMRSTY